MASAGRGATRKRVRSAGESFMEKGIFRYDIGRNGNKKQKCSGV